MSMRLNIPHPSFFTIKTNSMEQMQKPIWNICCEFSYRKLFKKKKTSKFKISESSHPKMIRFANQKKKRNKNKKTKQNKILFVEIPNEINWIIARPVRKNYLSFDAHWNNHIKKNLHLSFHDLFIKSIRIEAKMKKKHWLKWVLNFIAIISYFMAHACMEYIQNDNEFER